MLLRILVRCFYDIRSARIPSARIPSAGIPFAGISSTGILWILAAFVLTLASACQQARQQTDYTFYGGATRSGNYEQSAATFSNAMIIRDKPRKDDSLASSRELSARLRGATMPPVPLSFTSNYLTTLDGFVVRYANNIVEWKAAFDAQQTDAQQRNTKTFAASFPCTDKDDTFYALASDGAVYSIGKDGKRKWKKALFAPGAQSLFSDLLIVADGIIVGFSDNGSRGNLVKLDFTGGIVWNNAYMLAPTRTFAADEQGNVIAALSANTTGSTDSIVSIAPNGSLRWMQAVEATRLLRMPVVAGNRILVWGIREQAGQRGDVVCAFDIGGKPLWTKQITFTPQGIAVGTRNDAPLIVVAGYRVGMGEPLTLVLGLDANGKEQWKLSYNLAIMGAPMISLGNIVFVGTKGEAVGVYFMDKNGVYQNVVSLSDAPPMCLIPAVDSENNLVFATTDEIGLIKVGKLPVQRILPY
jgi:outer membrane protein assembly factor BamB